MTLGEFVKRYREEHNLSVRSFANLSGVSPQQIINIENGIGNDGKPMTSTMRTYRKIASAVGMDETEFLKHLNDDVAVNPSLEKIPMAEEVEIILNNWEIMSDNDKAIIKIIADKYRFE